MGVVYFSIIPTFEPSRYYKCWIVCFYNKNYIIQENFYIQTMIVMIRDQDPAIRTVAGVEVCRSPVRRRDYGDQTVRIFPGHR